MEFWSKGLGRRSLILAIGEEEVVCEDERVALSGTVVAPVTWRYTMYLEGSDWRDLFTLAMRPSIASYLLSQRRASALGRLFVFLVKFSGLYVAALLRSGRRG